ncbi:Beta-lactamase domain-containing protein [Fusarium falciforme]|uniref:Beta-lactamase domain-containing protein n=1 Tax=Fusarium falciforme TaxID=195108 RepID=UPI00230156C6|nr:Beta-lactamase domain-containing protein [Fusarium falciforme]WAO88762.1 Beta-lactamase domain-containing protein [Fusarium falciforme]
MFINPSKTPRLVLGLLTLLSLSEAQTAHDCPLWGPIYPAPTNVLKSTIVTKAIDNLKQSLDVALSNGTLGAANASFHLEVFSTDQHLLNYSYAAPQIKDSLTAGVLNRDTVFRIGSVSKLVAVYTLLAATGMEYINDPVTKWVPELAAASVPDDRAVDAVRWQDITIGALAGHQAGLLKDFSVADLTFAYNASIEKQLGLPVLPNNEIPSCGSDTELPACSRQEFFDSIKALHPVSAPFNMPIYSNPAFQILAYALEGITNKTFSQVFESSIVRPLHLNATYLSTPSVTDNLNAIIPGDEIESGWKIDVGDETSSAQGIMLSTGSDMAAIGQSILSSSLLSPVATRRWLKPISNTPDSHFSVGMPWEIRRIEIPSVPGASSKASGTRLVDLYTKNGGILGYYAQMALSPDHGLGFMVNIAGRPPISGPDRRSLEMNIINEMVTDIMVPAFEAAAVEQAIKNLAGTYVATDNSMEMTIVSLDGHLGLGVQNWTSGDLDLLVTYYAALSMAESVSSTSPSANLRLYPVGLHGGGKVAFRGVYGLNTNESVFGSRDEPWLGGCGAWAGVGEPPYGNIGLDDFVFDVDENGRATAITARGARKTLQRQE